MSIHDEYEKAMGAADSIRDVRQRLRYLEVITSAYMACVHGEAVAKVMERVHEIERIRRLPHITVAM
ncbi:hypothetical protein ACW0US_07145 [Xanthomonas euvesicatoria]